MYRIGIRERVLGIRRFLVSVPIAMVYLFPLGLKTCEPHRGGMYVVTIVNETRAPKERHVSRGGQPTCNNCSSINDLPSP
jgi:hypothetical protein